jgi:RNA polymerase sigma factor (sigma-70 family)
MTDPKLIHPADAVTREQFYGFLERLDGNRDHAARKYQELHFKLVKFFQWSYCSSAEDLADETLTRTARKLCTGEQEILDIEAFLWGVAKRIRQEGRKRDFKTVGFAQVPDKKLSDAGASIESIHRKIQMQKEGECLRNCLERLPEVDQQLFLSYRVDKGQYLERRKNLAKEFGLTPGALRVRVIRLREKLEKCLARCLGR